jgi:predicted alpha/beta superfamily hydrolase
MALCFLHGLDSSPQGTKSVLLRKRYPDCWIPALPPDVDERIGILESKVREPLTIIGSSLGGLTAIIYAMGHPRMVKGMVLLAPAVGVRDGSLFTEEQKARLSQLFIPRGIPTRIIAGVRDEVIPLSAIRQLVSRSPEAERIQLLEVDDDHNLHNSLDLMIQAVEEIRAVAGEDFG